MTTQSAMTNASRNWGWLSAVRLSPRGHARAAWALAAAMFAAALVFIARFGFTFPYRDEVEWVNVLVGEQPITLSWLWSQHAEHRMFLPRLLYVAITWLTDGNLRLGAVYNALVLTGVSALLMDVARRLRGHTRLSDALFPLAFLHWGHTINLIWVFQLNFVTAVALTCVVLAAVLRAPDQLSLRRAALVSCALVLMVLCGAYGMAYVPAMSAWLSLAAAARWREAGQGSRRHALILLLLAVVPMAAVGLYFVDYARPAMYPDAAWTSRLITATQMLSTSLGPASRQIWPVSGIIVVLGLALLAAVLMRRFWQAQGSRLRTAGTFCFLGGVLTLALGIGWGRAALGSEAGMAGRYMLLATPLLALGYLQAVLADSSVHGRRLQVALFVLMCVLLPISMRKGYYSAADFHSRFVSLEADIRAGLPPAGLACRHAYIYPSETVLLTRLESLQRFRFGAFAETDALGPLHAARVVPLAPMPQWNDVAGQHRLSRGESLSREFPVSAGDVLQRIEIQAGIWRRGRTPTSVRWSLSSVDGGQKRLLCGGEADLTKLQNQRFLTLPCGLHFPTDGHLHLSLHAPQSLAPGQYVEFPTFRSHRGDPELNLFLYTQPAAALAQAPTASQR